MSSGQGYPPQSAPDQAKPQTQQGLGRSMGLGVAVGSGHPSAVQSMVAERNQRVGKNC